jgi:hypothetical protein
MGADNPLAYAISRGSRKSGARIVSQGKIELEDFAAPRIGNER